MRMATLADIGLTWFRSSSALTLTASKPTPALALALALTPTLTPVVCRTLAALTAEPLSTMMLNPLMAIHSSMAIHSRMAVRLLPSNAALLPPLPLPLGRALQARATRHQVKAVQVKRRSLGGNPSS